MALADKHINSARKKYEQINLLHFRASKEQTSIFAKKLLQNIYTEDLWTNKDTYNL